MPILPAHDDRKREPKAIGQFIRYDHPWLAFAVAMSWIWRGVIATTVAALMAVWLS